MRREAGTHRTGALPFARSGRRAVRVFLAGVAAACGLTGFGFARFAKAPSGVSFEETSRPQANILHFPAGRSLGRVLVQDTNTDDSLDPFGEVVFNWRYLGEAQGDVAVPEGKRVGLWIHPAAISDLSPLSSLRPDDLYMLMINPYPGPGLNPDVAIMPYLRGLTGLRTLVLDHMTITEKGLRFLKDMRSLKHLRLSSERPTPPRAARQLFGDAGMACVGDLKSLETLWLSDPHISDAGLSYLANLDSLDELQLWSAGIRGPGLAHLAKLPSLRRLRLQLKLGDAGAACLKDTVNLRELRLADFGITDVGLSHLANLAGLEELDISRNALTDKGLAFLKPLQSLKVLNLSGTKITDNGLVHLKAVTSLTSLDLTNTGVTDDGLAYPSELKSLESLKLPSGIGDRGLAHIGALGNLKSLSLWILGASPITDAGLRHLAGLRSLEELRLRGDKVTDDGISHIAKLVHLNTLVLERVPISNAGLARLAALKSLRNLTLRRAAVTISGLAHLNAFPGLKKLELYNAPQDGATLDIGGLKQLELLDFGKTQLHNEDLACLAGLTRLRELYMMPQRGISDSGIAHLKGLTSLERLGLGGPHLTDKSLSYAADLNKLDYLWIQGGDFTDKGLDYLEGLKALRELDIASQNAFSNVAVDNLRKKLPNLQVLNVVP